MAENNVKVIRIDTQPAQQSLGDLKKQLKDLRNVMLNCAEGTEEYNNALRQAAEIQHTLAEQTKQIKNAALDFGQVTQNITGVVGGMVAGFQAATAAMNLFGIENQDVLKSLQKMQSLMAMTQALPQLAKGIDAFKGLRDSIAAATGATSKWGKALISTGIGAIIAALGYLIANFDEISQWLDELTGQTNFLGEIGAKVVGGLYAGWAALVQVVKAVGDAIITYVTTPFKAVWNAIQAYTSTEGGMAAKLKAAGKAMKDGFVSDWKDVGDKFKSLLICCLFCLCFCFTFCFAFFFTLFLCIILIFLSKHCLPFCITLLKTFSSSITYILKFITNIFPIRNEAIFHCFTCCF